MKKFFLFFIFLLLTIGIFVGGYFLYAKKYSRPAPIKVGVLHSLTGSLALSESAVVDATLFAIQELNERGGLNGSMLEPVVVDGKSDWPTFAQEAERLITQEHVAVIFGCWTSASRKLVKPVVEKYNSLLFYPVQYEGLEESQNIFYTGAAPNQQILPAVTWCFNNLGKKFFLVGSDYVFPRAANEIIKDHVQALGGTILGEQYLVLGGTEVAGIVQEIKTAQPNVIINTINGDSNIAFFKALRAAGITPEKIPVMSLSVAEQELAHLEASAMVGDYAAWSYFQSVRGTANEKFVAGFKKKYGAQRVVSDPMEAAYFGVHLWANAVRETGSVAVDTVRQALRNQSYNAPEGVVSIDPLTQHTWKFARIGKINGAGQFTEIWNSGRAVRPLPYPVYRDKTAWSALLENLYKQWGNQWAKA